ncbi:MAG TPA: hypothetical protein VM100_00460, partial [Longimicrobiales bacterium]|nr:hypothetical protein [Longimicrobiales bacterium]
MAAHEIAIALAHDYRGSQLIEADTRHQVIDPVLHDVLGWPRNRTKCEEYIAPGYSDYVLERSDGAKILLIEAKREGAYFSLPDGLLGSSLGAYVQVRTLLTQPDLSAAMLQVRDYCLHIGCDIGAVTNGHQWVFFKTFQRDEDWRKLRAFVIRSLSYFDEHFIEAHNHFSYSAITEKGALRRLLLDKTFHNRELFYPKLRVTSYDAQVDANTYASSLRPIADHYFGAIDAEDFDFMDSCYVSDREYDRAFLNARRRLEDALTPYLEQYGIQQFKDGG